LKHERSLKLTDGRWCGYSNPGSNVRFCRRTYHALYCEHNELSCFKPLPQHLGHRTIFAVPYKLFDSIYANNTDAKYISVGLTQYDQKDLSVKIMRHTANQWSPQSGELPVYRVIDMALLVAKALCDSQNGSLTIMDPKNWTTTQANFMIGRQHEGGVWGVYETNAAFRPMQRPSGVGSPQRATPRARVGFPG
jgi:hypothetical protein